jgi:predicted RNase H-like nuclease
MRVAGVDGCRDGWVAVALDAGGFAGLRVAPSLAALLQDVTPGQVAGIDMPLGLLAEGWRAADAEARRLLGRRRSSVFLIPPRPVWQEPSYATASERCRALTGKGLSAQAWGLRRKLLEADEYRLRGRCRLHEVHPELSFQVMAGAPLRHGKHVPAGHAERHRILAAAGIVIPAGAAPRAVAADALDAAAVAWTAQRIAAGQARTLPDPPQRDEHGYEIAIRS